MAGLWHALSHTTRNYDNTFTILLIIAILIIMNFKYDDILLQHCQYSVTMSIYMQEKSLAWHWLIVCTESYCTSCWDLMLLKHLVSDHTLFSPCAGKALGLWLLCPSNPRATSPEVPGGNTVLDGPGGHRQAVLQDWGGLCYEQISVGTFTVGSSMIRPGKLHMYGVASALPSPSNPSRPATYSSCDPPRAK